MDDGDVDDDDVEHFYHTRYNIKCVTGQPGYKRVSFTPTVFIEKNVNEWYILLNVLNKINANLPKEIVVYICTFIIHYMYECCVCKLKHDRNTFVAINGADVYCSEVCYSKWWQNSDFINDKCGDYNEESDHMDSID